MGDRDPRHAPLRDHGDQARPRGHARLPPRHRHRGGRARAGLPVDLAEPEVLRRPGRLLRVARGRPHPGWLQIMVLTCMQEAGTGFASKPQTDDAEAGDIALDSWVRYDDPEVKSFKLNAERQNGRAAMLGITG